MKALTSIIIATLLLSCGSRKAETHKRDIDLHTESTVQERIQTAVTEKKLQASVIEASEFTIEPVDALKPVVFVSPQKDTTKVYNAKITARKSREEHTAKETAKAVTVTNRQEETKQDAKITEKEKKTEREQSFAWIEWALTSVFVLWLLFLYFKRKKNNGTE